MLQKNLYGQSHKPEYALLYTVLASASHFLYVQGCPLLVYL
jgi:hypothetical protein